MHKKIWEKYLSSVNLEKKGEICDRYIKIYFLFFIIKLKIKLKREGSTTKESTYQITKSEKNHSPSSSPWYITKTNVNKQKRKKHSKNHIEKFKIRHNPPQIITNHVNAREVQDNNDVVQNQ